MLGVIDRYLLSEVSKTFAAILVTFTLVMITLLFLRMFETVAVGQLNADLVLRLVGLQTLRYLPRLLPLAFYFAVLVVLIRMHRDSEMIALAAGGVGPLSIYRGIMLLTVPLAALGGWMTLQVAPWASAELYQLLADQKQRGAELAGLRAGRFNEYSRGDLVVYVESIDDDKTMRNVFIQQRQPDSLSLVNAASGDYQFDAETGDHHIRLKNGRRYEGFPGRSDYSISHFDQYRLRISREAQSVVRKSSGLATSELLRSAEIRGFRAELEERFSYPLSIFTLALVALPLSGSLPRQGMYGRLFAALLVYITFLNLHRIAASWLESGATPLWLGMWWLQAIMLFIAASFWLAESTLARRLRRFFQQVTSKARSGQTPGHQRS